MCLCRKRDSDFLGAIDSRADYGSVSFPIQSFKYEQTGGSGWRPQQNRTNGLYKVWEGFPSDGAGGTDDRGRGGRGNDRRGTRHPWTYSRQPARAAWEAEAKRIPKVNNPHVGDTGTRNEVSPLERSQIVNKIS